MADFPVFDGHNDMVNDLLTGRRSFFERGPGGHVDLPRARAGGLAGGFCALFPRADGEATAANRFGYDLPIEQPAALRQTCAMMALFFRLERDSSRPLKIVRTVDDIEACLRADTFAALLHVEGAEAIDPQLHVLEILYQAGVRSLGPVWSRPNIFGHGVPFEFGRSPDTGAGLTNLGKELIQACNQLHIMIDLSHLNEAGFWDVARLSRAPLVASHSNAWSLSPATRNLTDRQLDAIRASDGLVGVNFAVGFLRADNANEADTEISLIADHIDYLVARLGIESVGFGSDFDGATIPRGLGDAAGLPRLIDVLAHRHYDETALRKLTHQNWMRVLRLTLDA